MLRYISIVFRMRPTAAGLPPISAQRRDCGAQNLGCCRIGGDRFSDGNAHAWEKPLPSAHCAKEVKAKLANVFRWKLSELGYSKPFVERVTKEVVTRLAVR